MAYTTTALLKTYLGITGSGDDTLLTALIARAQAVIDSHCRRTFEASGDTTRYFDAERDVDGVTLFLDEDLCAITSITNGDGDVLTASEYTTEPRNRTPYYAIRLLGSSGLYWTVNDSSDAEDAIAIVGKWAYSTSAPDDIVHATLRLAGYLYRQRDNAADLDRPVIAGNATVLPSQLPSDLKTLLAPYRKVV